MELRMMKTREQREAFAYCLKEIRATKGLGFREKNRSTLGEAHLTFGDVYGVFDETSAEPDRMLAGFILHSFDQFPQSYPTPDLTEFDPQEAFEAGELWSRSRGAGIVSRLGCSVILSLRKARALVIYAIVSPWDLTLPYQNFDKVGAPIVWPFAETNQGEKILVQPLLLGGESLARTLALATSIGFEVFDDGERFRFDEEGLLKRISAIAAARESPIAIGSPGAPSRR
jgi:hypothetical protein